MEDDGYDILFKIILVGDTSVGKTNIINKYIKNEFREDFYATIGVEFSHKIFVVENRKIKAQIWDTAGQERYKAITRAYYKGAKGAFIVYDITRKESFENVTKWAEQLKSTADKNLTIIIVGNKTDLEDQRQITKEEAAKFGEDHSFNFFLETSAKTGFNAQNIFIRAAKELYMTHLDYRDRATRPSSMITVPSNNQYDMNANNFMIDDEDEKPRKKSGCC